MCAVFRGLSSPCLSLCSLLFLCVMKTVLYVHHTYKLEGLTTYCSARLMLNLPAPTYHCSLVRFATLYGGIVFMVVVCSPEGRSVDPERGSRIIAKSKKGMGTVCFNIGAQ